MEKTDIKNYLKNKYLLLNAIHSQIFKLSKKEKNNSKSSEIIPNQIEDNILIKYLENPYLLFSDNNNLINFMTQLSNYIKEKENILFPFLNACPTLVKAYIQSDLDEEKLGEYKYMKVFNSLIKTSFISKENLFPIYSFFSNLFLDIATIKEDDIRLRKIIKIIDLWLIFYSFDKDGVNGEEKNEFKESSICFLGGSLTIHLKEDISIEKKIIDIKINLLRNDYMNLIKEENSFLRINNCVLIAYKDLQKYIKDKVYSITIIIEYKKITIYFNYTDPNGNDKQKNSKNKEKIKTFSKSMNIPKIKDIIFLDNFYGEVNLIVITFKKVINKKETEVYFENVYKPFLETNSGYLKKENEQFSINKDFEQSSGSIKKQNKINMSLKITDKNFTKVNYINYADSDFNIVEYFGTEAQLLPFIYIIQKLFINNNIKKINNENKNKICFIFLDRISQGFFNCILYNKYSIKIIKKYFLFVYSILLEVVKTYNKIHLLVKNKHAYFV